MTTKHLPRASNSWGKKLGFSFGVELTEGLISGLLREGLRENRLLLPHLMPPREEELIIKQGCNSAIPCQPRADTYPCLLRIHSFCAPRGATSGFSSLFLFTSELLSHWFLSGMSTFSLVLHSDTYEVPGFGQVTDLLCASGSQTAS